MRISSGPCVIVGGGPLDMEWAKEYVEEIPSPMTIACDKGISFFFENNWCPDLFVSDDDSADPVMIDWAERKEQALKHPLPVHKDVTDSEEALQIAIEAGCDPIYLIGMTGGRLDHTIGNIQILRQAADAGVHAYLVDEYSRALMVCTGNKEIVLEREKAYGKCFSLFAIGGQVAGLTIEGAEYPLKDAILFGSDSLGVSNQFEEDEVRISFESGHLLVVESRD